MKKRTIWGMALSIVWLMLCALYVHFGKSWAELFSIGFNDFGGFFSGVFAPLAFLWLVIGYAQQGEELAHNVAALRQQAKETANLVQQAQFQADAIRANELHARRDTFFRYADMLTAAQCEMLISGLDPYVSYDPNEHWPEYAQGRVEIFHKRFLNSVINRYIEYPLLWEKEEFSKKGKFKETARLYIENYEQLTAKALECDPDKSILTVIEQGYRGQVYIGLCELIEHSPKLYLQGGISFMTPEGRV